MNDQSYLSGGASGSFQGPGASFGVDSRPAKPRPAFITIAASLVLFLSGVGRLLSLLTLAPLFLFGASPSTVFFGGYVLTTGIALVVVAGGALRGRNGALWALGGIVVVEGVSAYALPHLVNSGVSILHAVSLLCLLGIRWRSNRIHRDARSA